jgi:hypothetical protein
VATSMPELDTLSRAVALRKQLKSQLSGWLFFTVPVGFVIIISYYIENN